MKGDVEFDADAALLVWGGSEGAKIADLTPGQLLQFALIDAHQQLQECYEVIEQMVIAEQVVANLNREQRRKLEKVQSKLILPK
jgi:lipoate-protein ligase B